MGSLGPQAAGGELGLTDLTVSVVNTNNRAFLLECLETLTKACQRYKVQIIVIDNASMDGSADMVRERFPEVILLENRTRLGFSANHNQALQQGSGRYLMILNEDVNITPGAFDHLMEWMDAHPEVGAGGPRILNADGTVQLSCFYDAGLLHEAAHYLLAKFAKQPWAKRSYPLEAYETSFYPGWLQGSCIVFRREALDQVGLMDDNFFFYWEDVDICKRMWKAGWKVGYCPEGVITHYYGGSRKTATVNERMFLQFYRSRYRYFQKHNGVASLLLLITFVTLVDMVRAVKALISIAWRENTEEQLLKAKRLLSAIRVGFSPASWSKGPI